MVPSTLASASASSSSSSSSTANSAAEQMFDVWRALTPIVSQNIFFVSLISAFLVFLFPYSYTLGLSNIPLFSFYHVELYRLITSPFVSESVFGGIMTSYWALQIGILLELQNGSANYLLKLIRVTILTNVLFIVSIMVVSEFFDVPFLLLSDCKGWPPIILALEMYQCTLSPPTATRQFMFIPIRIPVRFYPWFLLFVLTIMTSAKGLAIDLLCGLCIGWIEAKKQWKQENLIQFFEDILVPLSLSGHRGTYIPSQHSILPTTTTRTATTTTTLPGGGSIIPSSSVISRLHRTTNEIPISINNNNNNNHSTIATTEGNRSNSRINHQNARAAALAAAEARMQHTSSSISTSTANITTTPQTSTRTVLADSPFQYDHELLLLQDMGYSAEKCRPLLIVHKGDISSVVSELNRL